MLFNRSDFYSKTEACKLFKLSPAKFDKLIIMYQLQVLEHEITTADYSSQQYSIKAKYVLKCEFDKVIK